VVVLNMLRGAMTHVTSAWREGDRAHDQQIALALGRWTNGRAMPGSVAPGKAEFGTGGVTYKALRNLLQNSGLDVKSSPPMTLGLQSIGPALVARMPSGTTLCVGGFTQDNKHGAPENPLLDGSSSGLFSLRWTDGGKKGHAMAYVRTRDQYTILDSNGSTYSSSEAFRRYIPRGSAYDYEYSPMYTCRS
jgi:hypothetical protein